MYYMTNEEAINTIKTAIAEVEWYYPMDYAIAFENAISSLEKQIPKKVNVSLKGTTDWNTKCHCPNCHSMVSHGKYCSNCGQSLDFNSNGSDTE